MVIFFFFFGRRGKTCTNVKLIFPTFSVLILLRFKKFALIVFL